ncbi:MAG: methyltransferase domain-containing protein [Pseudomonadota bacterium]
MSQQAIEDVQEYYGKELQTNEDLKTSACCPLEAPPERIQKLLKNVHDTVQAKFYGCGSPIPVALEGRTVLDLGCGTGRDAFILSQLVGETGQVIGVDMTDEQLSVANQYLGWHMNKFGYSRNNVDFRKAFIEDLHSANIADESVDVVISNCVINLSTNKEQVFKEIYRVLKPGGELYFSDVFSGRRIPKEVQTDPAVMVECLGGALYTEDFRRMIQAIGIADARSLSKRQLTIEDEYIQQKAGMIDFYSMTMRAFKVELEDVCEDYGHVAWYQGTIDESPHSFVLDDHHEFKTGMPVPICGNTANMLSQTRLAKHFRLEGDFSTHYGLFDCSQGTTDETASEACC